MPINIKKTFVHIGELKTNCTGHLDVSFSEDASRKRNKNAAQNYSVLLKIALNLLKNEKTEKQGSSTLPKILINLLLVFILLMY
jgi:hypothetical protein